MAYDTRYVANHYTLCLKLHCAAFCLKLRSNCQKSVFILCSQLFCVTLCHKRLFYENLKTATLDSESLPW